MVASTSTTASDQVLGGSMASIAKLRLDDDDESSSSEASSDLSESSLRPECIRTLTDPGMPLLQTQLKERPRNRSPYTRTHLRSQSHASALATPPMVRTRSLPLPVPSSMATLARSPARSPVRPSSPLRQPPTASRGSPRRSLEETFSSSGVPSFMDIESIAEDSELDITPRNSSSRDGPTSSTTAFHSVTFGRSNSGRRRPSSPLHYQSVPPTTTSPTASSPTLGATKFNEPYPGQSNTHNLPLPTTPSMTSTPTSLRSRSPSISSLETIPDSPDAEEAAIEAYNIAQLKAAADAAEAEAENESKGRNSLDSSYARSSATGSSRKDRKRWSVCGAERRADFEMETIWED